MSVTMTDDVSTYVQAVRAALADLPAVQRDELLEDLSQHLGEVAAEGDAPLSVRLGSPTAYAEELRASIGLSGERPRGAGRRLQDLAARFNETLDAAAGHPTGRAVLDFLPELRPGWWVLRGYLFVAVPSVLLDYAGPGSFPLPTVSGSRVLGLLATLAAVVASVTLGRRTARDSRRRRLVVVGNTLLVLAALVAFGSGRAVPELSDYPGPRWSGYLTGPDGTSITDIFPYGADGKPLTGVRLYDQNGRPIDNVGDPAYGGKVPEGRRMLIDSDGNQVTNAYPLEQRAADSGMPPTVGSPPTAVPSLASASPSVSPAPSAGQSVSPPVTPRPSSSVAPSFPTSPPAPQPTP